MKLDFLKFAFPCPIHSDKIKATLWLWCIRSSAVHKVSGFDILLQLVLKGQTAQITLILVNGHADTFRCMCWGFEISEIFVLPKAVKKQILRKSVAICFSTNNIQVTQDNKQISEQMFLW